MGYLDNAGLAHLWGKIKTALLGKQDALIAGPGIKIEGNVISAEEFPAWTETALPFSEYWRGVVYGDGKFVAITSNSSSKAAYSTDGKNWTEATLPFSGNWESVTYGAGKFVAVAYGGSKAAYSTDGKNWIETTLPFSGNWESVTYGAGKFVAVAYDTNRAAYSTDGATWTETTLPFSAKWRSVAYGNGIFVAVVSGDKKAAYSTDGIAWIETTLPIVTYWQCVTHGNGKFVAVGFGGNAAYSLDGVTWTAVKLPFAADFRSVVHGNGKFAATADSSKAAYSTDGVTWTEAAMPFDGVWYSVTYGNGKFVAIAYGVKKAAYAAFTNVTFDGLNDELALKGDELALDGQTLSLKSGDDVLSSVELPGGGGSYSGEAYSTEERRIGTWIDGKPIYQRVVSGVLASNAGNLISVTGENSGIDTVLRLDTELIPIGSIYHYFGTSFQESNSTWFRTFTINGDVLVNCGPAFDECTATVIIEYTKTTDPATIELPASATQMSYFDKE